MAERVERHWICDLCGHEEVKVNDASFPVWWTRYRLEPLNGHYLDGVFYLCRECTPESGPGKAVATFRKMYAKLTGRKP